MFRTTQTCFFSIFHPLVVTFMTYLEKSQQLHDMVDQGQMMEALDKFYHDDVVVIDGLEAPRNGKAVQKKSLEGWMAGIQEVHGGGVTGITSDEAKGITMAESWMELTMKDGNRMKMEEVAVQKWKGDKIIHERFYYNMPGQ